MRNLVTLVAATCFVVAALAPTAAAQNLNFEPDTVYVKLCEKPDLHGTVNDAQACANAAIDATQGVVRWTLEFACQVLC